ncbi:hypothetical protein F5878DRAFT_29770 [Lentinula raphanica]|uniref:Uncharacterized protein n=1 Tax=Lentinula raphanica TaxID=153919 RepID=A0AA38UHA7_9AGAR|nr:hypothetical protein F5880DRAFT_179698 [Lentinula raphanica]KAJ3841185.1 hypothetical protein F5878DRAFT_29770 [Lentinula raphanica]
MRFSTVCISGALLGLTCTVAAMPLIVGREVVSDSTRHPSSSDSPVRAHPNPSSPSADVAAPSQEASSDNMHAESADTRPIPSHPSTNNVHGSQSLSENTIPLSPGPVNAHESLSPSENGPRQHFSPLSVIADSVSLGWYQTETSITFIKSLIEDYPRGRMVIEFHSNNKDRHPQNFQKRLAAKGLVKNWLTQSFGGEDVKIFQFSRGKYYPYGALIDPIQYSLRIDGDIKFVGAVSTEKEKNGRNLGLMAFSESEFEAAKFTHLDMVELREYYARRRRVARSLVE